MTDSGDRPGTHPARQPLDGQADASSPATDGLAEVIEAWEGEHGVLRSEELAAARTLIQ